MTSTDRMTKIEATNPLTGQTASVTFVTSPPTEPEPLRLGDTAILRGTVHWVSDDEQYADISMPSLGEIRVLVSDIFDVIPRFKSPKEEVAFLREENKGLRNDVAAAEQAYEKLLAERGPIPHNGDTCPVADHNDVIVRFRSGQTVCGPAVNFSWLHVGGPNDIVSYLRIADLMRFPKAKP